MGVMGGYVGRIIRFFLCSRQTNTSGMRPCNNAKSREAKVISFDRTSSNPFCTWREEYNLFLTN